MAQIIQTNGLDLSTLSSDEGYWIYNGLDNCVTLEIANELLSQADAVALKTYQLSKDLQAPVLEMNIRGIKVSPRKKAVVVAELTAKIKQLEDQLDTIISEGIGVDGLNWRSPKQLKTLLYDVLSLPVQKKRNASGAYAPTTDSGALETLSAYFLGEPICSHLLALRSIGKSLGFLNSQTDPDGRMRTKFNIAGTNTGRFSSSITDFGTGTNLQNVASSLRSVFVADPGMMFCNIDLEQADSRNVGALCWNTFVETHGEAFAGSYLDACESEDLHTLVTKMAYGDLPWGSDADRAIANQPAYRHLSYRDLSKKLGHGSNYLGQPHTMAKHARITRVLAESFQSAYFTAFPCIPAWHKTVFSSLETLGYLTTPFGRRRFFFDRPTAGATQREAVAYQPQSMTGDEMNIGLLNLWRANRVQLLVQVHDSILFQFPEHLRDEIVPWAMETILAPLCLARGRELIVPVDAATGWNWGYVSDSNPDGLRKWKGGDERRRQETSHKLNLADF